MLAPVLIFQVDEIYPRVRAYDWFDADALFFVFEENWDSDLVINNLMALHVQAFSIGIPRNSGDVLLVSPEHLIAAIEVSIEYWEDWQEQGRDSTRSPLKARLFFSTFRPTRRSN